MSAKSKNKTVKEVKIGAQHFIVFLMLAGAFFMIFHFSVMPNAMSSFVRSLFSPYGEQLEKIGFAEFKDGVWASIPKDLEMQSYKNTVVSRDITNREYIFDFTFQERSTAIHGYSKKNHEFYAKAPKLGDYAIIIEPHVCLSVLSMVLALLVTGLITAFLPTGIGYMSALFYNQIEATKVKLRLQTGLTDEIIELIVMPDDQLRNRDVNEIRSAFRTIWERTILEDLNSSHTAITFDDVYFDDIDIVVFRNQVMYKRMKEFYSSFLLTEIEDAKNGILWSANHFKLGSGLRLYMTHHFCEKYQNLVTGLAYGGAAFLIVAIGIRGLKFIPADKPSIILLAISLEFAMLALMATTLVYSEGEERMDKIMKKMEDGNRNLLDAQRGQQADIHMLTNALVGQTSTIIKERVEKAIEEFMTSNDEVEKKVAGAVAERILVSLKTTKELNESNRN